MSVTIQSDMMRAAEMLPKTQRGPFLLALLDYGEYGREPEGKPAWLPAFEVCKERINMSEARRKQSQELNEAKRKKKAARSDRTVTPHGDTARSDRTDTPEMSRVEMSRDETTTTRACAREGGGGGGGGSCMNSPIRMKAADGETYPTPGDALRATYAERAGSDVGFSRAFAAIAPREACASCPRTGAEVKECAKAAKDALLDWDRGKASSPIGILKAAMRQVDGNG